MTEDSIDSLGGMDFVSPMSAIMEPEVIDDTVDDPELPEIEEPDLEEQEPVDSKKKNDPDDNDNQTSARRKFEEDANKDKDVNPKNEPGDDNLSVVDEMVEPMVEYLAEEWGMNLKTKPKNLEEFKDFLDKVIETNTKHEFFNEDSALFDRYLRNGGDPVVFLKSTGEKAMIDKLDVEKADDHEDIFRMYYEKKGLGKGEIERNLKRAKLAEELETEVKEIYPELQKIAKNEQVELEKRQAQAAEQERNAVIEWQNSVVETVDATDNVFGFQLTKKEKAALLPYLLQKDKDGYTQYMKDYHADPVGWQVATAFAYLNRDKLVSLLAQPAKNQAVTEFRRKQQELNERSKKTTTDMSKEDDSEDLFIINARRASGKQ